MLPLLSVAQFAPPAGQEGSTAIHADSAAIVGWATGCVVERGPMRIDQPESGLASYGVDDDGIGKADGLHVVSLGDGGNAVLTFESPISNGPGYDFAVFENAFKWAVDTTLYFLELAFVEVSSDGVNYVRFPAVSNYQTEVQCGSFECTDPRLFHNFAGKYASLYGTPFDLDELPDDPLLDKNHVTHVRIVDVVGTLLPKYASYDSEGHVVNDPWPTPFNSSGFDLDAVGVLHDQSQPGVHESETPSLSVYPNPASETLFVDGPAELVSLYTLTGQKLMETRQHKMDVSQLTPGVYVARIAAKDTMVITKFIKK